MCVYVYMQTQPAAYILCGGYAYVFSAHHLRFDNLSGGSLLENTDSFPLTSHQSLVALYLWVELCEIFLVHTDMSTGIVIMQVLLNRLSLIFQLPCHI